MRKTHEDRHVRKIPPLNSLKAFEASARRKSITEAANELAVTQSAISKQIKTLEEYLGLKLFERKYQRIALTKQAEIYLPSIQAAFETIEQATNHLLGHSNKTENLRLNLLPSLSNRWLIPMLNDFKKSHPKIAINLEMGDGAVDFDSNEIDIAIRVSKFKKWKGIYAEKFMDEDLIAVCSPTIKPVKLAGIQKHTLLQHTSRPTMWNEYLSSAGYKHIKIDHQLGFEHFFMLIDAAIDGLGVALIPRLLIEVELTEGLLVPAFDHDYPSPFSYYFLCKKEKLSLEKIQNFRNWLFSKTCSY
jgi:LysR family transcriptional regulator, glycine cleavage system transcriptional activator